MTTSQAARPRSRRKAVFSESSVVDTWNETDGLGCAKGIREGPRGTAQRDARTGGERAKIAAQTIKADFAQKNGLDPNTCPPMASLSKVPVVSSSRLLQSERPRATSDTREDPAYQR